MNIKEIAELIKLAKEHQLASLKVDGIEIIPSYLPEAGPVEQMEQPPNDTKPFVTKSGDVIDEDLLFYSGVNSIASGGTENV